MSISCGKKARKSGGNRYAIKKSWRRAKRAAYREGDKERTRQHMEFEKRGSA